ncbi:hypothetical protein PSTT_08007 [Puccinia striiformis]|uniref:Uncharacterized protein n=1 Tax=Puccinia striiformis TaxID=27350 RepID=A0A2S4VE62_9BASI|nr:hypothetical protein PSTT_08007 [Puccinia striiformis]
MANSLAKSMMVSGAAPCMEIGTAHSGDDLVADLCRNRPEIPIRPARAGSAGRRTPLHNVHTSRGAEVTLRTYLWRRPMNS